MKKGLAFLLATMMMGLSVGCGSSTETNMGANTNAANAGNTGNTVETNANQDTNSTETDKVADE